MKIASYKITEPWLSVALFLLRTVSSYLLIINHGWGKLVSYGDRAGSFGDPLNIGTQFSLSLAVFAEVFCAAFVFLGLFTRLASLPIVILFSVVLLKISKNVSAGPAGGELAAMFLLCFATILITGPGRYSIDKLIAR